MAFGSVAISGGMSKKEKERLMYMDGKLVWSTSGFTGTAPTTVDYLIVKNVLPQPTSNASVQDTPTEVRVARGCKGIIGLYQTRRSSGSTTASWSYATLTFDTSGKLTISYPGDDYTYCLHVEGYQYI